MNIANRKPMNAANEHFFFRISKKKLEARKLFELLNLFMIDTFLMKFTHFEKTGSIAKIYIKFHFRN